MSSTVIQASKLTALVTALFAARGMAPIDAATVAANLVWAELHGIASHGVSRVERYMRMIDAGDLDPRGVPVLEEKGPSLVVLRANRAAGAVAMKVIVEEAVQRAKRTGSCIGLVAQTTHTGAIGQYAERLASEGLAAIVLGAGPPMMAYHGARIPSLSTSPLAIGIPARNRPLVMDMATAAVALGRIRQSKDGTEGLPPGVALDAEGRPTTDPATASTALPVGGAKGSGLSLLFECLTSLMVGVPILSLTIGPGGDGRHRHNAMVIAIDVARVTDLATYHEEVARLAAVIKSLAPREGFEAIRLPGERGAATAEERRHAGIPMAPGTWASLQKSAAHLGIDMNDFRLT